MTRQEIALWLLEGDVSVQYQTYRDVLEIEKPALRKKIATAGWGERFLSFRQKDGHWGNRFYFPKWTSSHYTLLDLKNLSISPDNKKIKDTLDLIFDTEKGPDGGILPIGTERKSDVCVNGMVLNYAAYFQVKEVQLNSIVDFLLNEKMNDGGFNCWSNRKGARHSSLHTTISVLEGIEEYRRNGYTYRLEELLHSRETSHEFILIHKLFKSDKTGEIINPNFLKLYYPSRWYYDILRALDYFQYARVQYDPRMQDSLDILIAKRTRDGLWKLASKHPGVTHFEMEQAGKASRWNTLRALRVLKYYKIDSDC